MKEFNWVAQDADGEIYKYDRKPGIFKDVGYAGLGTKFKLIVRGKPNPNWRDTRIDLSENGYVIKDGILMATRKHAALIHAWADGAEIQYLSPATRIWCDIASNKPYWEETIEYRIKPKPKVIRFMNYMFEGSIKVHKEGDPHPNPKFTQWIDKEWQEVEIEL